MKKKCENINCTEPSYKKVLIRDKKNKEYKNLCYDHYNLHLKENKNIGYDWENCDQIGEFKAPSKIAYIIFGFARNILQIITKNGISLTVCHKQKLKTLCTMISLAIEKHKNSDQETIFFQKVME